MIRTRNALLALLIAIAPLACGGDESVETADGGDEAPAEPARAAEAPEDADPRQVVIDMRQVPWAVPLAVNLDDMILQQSGLYVQVLADGTGPRATPGDTLAVHYRLWLPSGLQVDASYDHSPPEPLEMVLGGDPPLIDGWSQGVTGMRVGERRRLVLPHELAYGPAGRPPIPPYSPLLFEVELVRLAPGDLPGGE